MADYVIDATDRKILAALLSDARKPFMEIARECGVSGAAIHQRIKKLEHSGIITGSTLLVKPESLGLEVCAFINVTITQTDKYDDVVRALKALPEIVECHYVTGRSTLLLKVYCIDNDDLINHVIRAIQVMPFIQSTETLISLDCPFDRQVSVRI